MRWPLEQTMTAVYQGMETLHNSMMKITQMGCKGKLNGQIRIALELLKHKPHPCKYFADN